MRSTKEPLLLRKAEARRAHARASSRTTDALIPSFWIGKQPKCPRESRTHAKYCTEYLTLSRDRNISAIGSTYIKIPPFKGGGNMDFDLSARSEQWGKKLQAFRPGGASAPSRLGRTHCDTSRNRALHERPSAEGEDGGIMESRASRTRDRRAGDQVSNLEYAPLAEIMGRECLFDLPGVCFWLPHVWHHALCYSRMESAL